MDVLILGVILWYTVSTSLRYLMVSKELIAMLETDAMWVVSKTQVVYSIGITASMMTFAVIGW